MTAWSCHSLTKGGLLNQHWCPQYLNSGPDALLEPMTVDEFTESLSKRKIAVKALLLDQSFIAGIGNWIADEVLYQARIHPLQIAASLSKESCLTLHQCIKEVIEKAVEVGADSSQFPTNWIFHSRENKPGRAFVDGKKIDFITAGGRTSAYVPELQKLSGSQGAKEAGKRRRQTSKRKSSKNDDDSEEPTNEEEENLGSAKLNKGPAPRDRGKKRSTKRKSTESEDEDAAADDGNDNGNNDDTDQVLKRTGKMTINNKHAKEEKTSMKKVQTTQNNRNKKKKAK
ncbi:Formamidopyrimidine-DNA glycosylase [Quillaja saponaria]|uniref:Formamidopyrimidine-DNA glycosylase n=1 Tax=Quillaja saponaria TaxID=32244 RepID=A0AAD7LR69_QUISA|nr:Formamidopyrimidine-DNA glycosylase [Quillaja saponaria]